LGHSILVGTERKSEAYTFFDIHLRLEPPLPEKMPPDFPAALHYAEAARSPHGPRPVVDQACYALIWPSAREAWCAAGACSLADNLDWWEACWGNRVYLEPLLDPDTHPGRMARLLLLLGLAAKEPGERGLATDVLIAAITDGRVTGASLGEILAEVLALGPAKGARLAKTLADAARTSPLHGETVRTALEMVLAGAPELRPADLGALLELLQELCVLGGTAVATPAAREFLQAQGGSGKTAKLAKALLALSEAPQAVAYRRQAASLALAGRVERAERWARLTS
jgi:hypothetical protein